jgi:hypothetical protein
LVGETDVMVGFCAINGELVVEADNVEDMGARPW